MNDVRLTQSGLQVNIKSHDNQRELPLNTKNPNNSIPNSFRIVWIFLGKRVPMFNR